MITGDVKDQIDRIWDSFWSGGISNPLEVIEQITYLLFIRRLDDLHQLEENKANRLKNRWSGGSSPQEMTPRAAPTKTSVGRASSISLRPRCSPWSASICSPSVVISRASSGTGTRPTPTT